MDRPRVARFGKLNVGSARCRPLNVGPLYGWRLSASGDHLRLRTLTLAACALAALLASCASGTGANSGGVPRTTPQPTGSVYTSKLGNFTCKVPALLRPGAYQMERGDAD